MVFSLLPVTFADTVQWDGQSVDYSWYYDTAAGTYINTDTYFISSPAQLAGLARIVNGTADYTGDGITDSADYFTNKTINLTDNIDLNNMEWTPIGGIRLKDQERSFANYFEGIFNGNFYTVIMHR
jgi:hypothetical protein